MLVIETASDIQPESSNAIKEYLHQLGVSSNSGPEVFGTHVFHYYKLDNIENVDTIIDTLSRLPGVNAAYIKPEGAPPQ